MVAVGKDAHLLRLYKERMNAPKEPGIYQILNIRTGDCYIGKAINVRQRLWSHRSMLRGNRHQNQHLQRAWNKYGEAAFDFRVVQLIGIEWLSKAEAFWAGVFKKDGWHLPAYNQADIDPETGHNRHSEESKEKLRQKALGREVKLETREKIGAFMRSDQNTNRGRVHGPDVRGNLRDAQHEWWEAQTEEIQGAKIERMRLLAQSNVGKKLNRSEEGQRRNTEAVVAAHLGVPQTEESNKKRSAALKGNTNRKGKPFMDREKSVAKMKNSQAKRRRPVVALNPESLEMIFFESVASTKESGFRLRSVLRCLAGERPFYLGLAWMYQDEVL